MQGKPRPRFANLSLLENNTPNCVNYTNIVWVPVINGEELLLSNNPTVAVPLAVEENDHLNGEMLNREVTIDLEGKLNPRLAQVVGVSSFVHQGLAAMQFLKQWQRNVHYVPHDQFPLRIKRGAEEWCRNLKKNPLLILLHSTNVLPDSTQNLYDYLRIKQKTSSVLRCFPRHEEWVQAKMKVRDIKALDEIARKYSPANWRYRPKTCFRDGFPCVLAGYDTWWEKRTSSCAKRHVEKQTKMSSEECKPRQQTDGNFYFHQEHVSSFDEVGEFRVFIVTEIVPLFGEDPPRAIRGRRGKVVHSILTRWVAGGRMASDRITDSMWEQVGLSDLCTSDLHSFALHVFDQIRVRDDALTCFESFELGARIDIALGPNRRAGDFFVNELTRIYAADFFPDTSGPPYTTVVQAYARALNEYFPCHMPSS